jgi:hypothetical protein
MNPNPLLRHPQSLPHRGPPEATRIGVSSHHPGKTYFTHRKPIMPQPQSAKNHARFDPLFHFTIVPLLILNIIAAIVWSCHHHTASIETRFWIVLLSIVLLMMAGMTRSYSLKVQDRVIRLEERLRMASLVSSSELAELDSLTMKQYIALRFASNPELPDLARRAIREHLTPKQIKEAISSWRPDNHRV